ncbi:MAG: tRNA (adenosine(37)-N6)-threonylcarbamoyltransferase complex transferase subunit TsaD [Minisyncoccales bacterium]
MKILAIDTSCDDTAISLIETKKRKIKILADLVSSQIKIHAAYGGVYPFLAKREHQKNLPIVLKRAWQKAGMTEKKIDLIAVTIGPGLEPCLWTGINFAKTLAKKLNLPIVPINHIEAHIFANFIHDNFQKIFPAICLVVSGGHTQLILMRQIGNYQLLGETRDDAAGECFDKTARILGLGYPGGPAIAATATKSKIPNLKFKITLPRPMLQQKNYDFSFSGLKTAVLYDYQKRAPEIKNSLIYQQIMCREIQQAIIDVLINKTIRAAKNFKTKSIILGGGVVANEELRKQFKKASRSIMPKIHLLMPPKKFCTDNAVMVAINALYHWPKKKTKKWQKIKAEANLKL